MTQTLTARELELTSLLVRGCNNADIAASMGLSERTVYGLVDCIKQKLCVENRAQLLRYIRDHGLGTNSPRSA
jgi:DNA-binding NarL/FixJ family response regulator